MKKEYILGLTACLASIILVTIAFQYFNLKRFKLGRHKYITANSLTKLNRPATENASAAVAATVAAVDEAAVPAVAVLDVAAGPVAAAVEVAVMEGEFTAMAMLLMRSVSTTEEKMLVANMLTNNITLNNLD